MFPMTPAQSWATLLILILLSIALTKFIADFNTALDRRQARKHANMGALPSPNNAAAPNLIRPVSRMSFDGFPIPMPGEIYDYAIHGI